MMDKAKQKAAAIWPVLVCLAGIAATALFWMREYRQAAFKHVSKFCEIFVGQNPGAEADALAAIKEYHAAARRGIGNSVFLEQYGYRADAFCNEAGSGFFITFLVLFLITAAGFFIMAKHAQRRSQARIAELTRYLEQVNTGAKGTVIQTKEDEFSHLQDEIYKTVTALCQEREAAVKAKLNFANNLANIAHQLKTPITAAGLSARLMKESSPNAYAEQILKQLGRLGRLEESLLTLSKIDAGVLELERKPVDIYTALNLAAENLSGLPEAAHVSVDIPDQGRVTVMGDLEWTMEAFINLIKNCMEHSPRGGSVHCAYSQNPIYTDILIWDEGEGFCPQDLPRLFERFYRGQRAAENGIGIGLSLARSIFAMQNGNISARNTPEGGACFEIRVYSH